MKPLKLRPRILNAMNKFFVLASSKGENALIPVDQLISIKTKQGRLILTFRDRPFFDENFKVIVKSKRGTEQHLAEQIQFSPKDSDSIFLNPKTPDVMEINFDPSF